MPRSAGTRPPNIYADGPLDRADDRRLDEAWLAERLADPSTRFVALWRSRNLVSLGPSDSALAAGPNGLEAIWIERTRGEAVISRGGDQVFLGLQEDRAFIAVDLSHLEQDEAEALVGQERSFRDLREVGPLLHRDQASVLAYARGLLHWHHRHRFCGLCGSTTVSAQGGHIRRCRNPDCGASHFPRTDPAVIMLIHDGGERCVLGRQKIWPPGMHSTLAGFVETGESLEDAVAREVAEEVGLGLEEIHYHSSQPWPFPSSIMLGFTAQARYAPLRVHPEELESAAWFSRDQLLASPENETFKLPRVDSIARRLIEDWLAPG